MPYRLEMHQVAVYACQRDAAERFIRRVLQQQLGGEDGVIDAFARSRAAAPHDLWGPPSTAPVEDRDAVARWRNAVELALRAMHGEFPQLVDQLMGEDLLDALAEEWVSITAT